MAETENLYVAHRAMFELIFALLISKGLCSEKEICETLDKFIGHFRSTPSRPGFDYDEVAQILSQARLAFDDGSLAN